MFRRFVPLLALTALALARTGLAEPQQPPPRHQPNPHLRLRRLRRACRRPGRALRSSRPTATSGCRSACWRTPTADSRSTTRTSRSSTRSPSAGCVRTSRPARPAVRVLSQSRFRRRHARGAGRLRRHDLLAGVSHPRRQGQDAVRLRAAALGVQHAVPRTRASRRRSRRIATSAFRCSATCPAASSAISPA